MWKEMLMSLSVYFYFRFDLANCNLNDEHVNKMNSDRVPDVVSLQSFSFEPVL